MSNDAKLGMLLGLAVVLASAVMFFRPAAKSEGQGPGSVSVGEPAGVGKRP